MKDIFEKSFLLEEFIDVIKGSSVLYINCESEERRADDREIINRIRQICSCDYYRIKYDYEKDAIVLGDNTFDLKKEVCDLFVDLESRDIIIINMTSMSIRVVGAFLAFFRKVNRKAVYCMYTEPKRYMRTHETVCVGEDRFNLYKICKGISPIPGFLRENDDGLEECWVVFLGFEEDRAKQILEQYEFKKIVPVVTLPSYIPGWHNYAIEENIDLLKISERKPSYVIANSVMSAYYFLYNLVESEKNSYFRISILGTKINALGALLFSLNYNKRVEILYDNPIADNEISEDKRKTHVFDISEQLYLDIVNGDCG